MSQNPIAVALFGKRGTAVAPAGVDAQGALSNTDRHGQLYSAAYAGTLWNGANQAGATTSVGLATTYVGLCLSNPAASGVNLSVTKASCIIIVAPTAETGIGLITGYSAAGVVTHTTALTPANANVGSAAAALAKLDAACTIVGTPRWERWLSVNIGTTNEMIADENVNGSILIPPGGYVAFGTTVAGPTAGFLGAFQWEELPV